MKKEQYLLQLYRYIELNPARVGINKRGQNKRLKLNIPECNQVAKGIMIKVTKNKIEKRETVDSCAKSSIPQK